MRGCLDQLHKQVEIVTTADRPRCHPPTPSGVAEPVTCQRTGEGALSAQPPGSHCQPSIAHFLVGNDSRSPKVAFCQLRPEQDLRPRVVPGPPLDGPQGGRAVHGAASESVAGPVVLQLLLGSCQSTQQTHAGPHGDKPEHTQGHMRTNPNTLRTTQPVTNDCTGGGGDGSEPPPDRKTQGPYFGCYRGLKFGAKKSTKRWSSGRILFVSQPPVLHGGKREHFITDSKPWGRLSLRGGCAR